jgi:hypothetical protein
MVHKLPSVLKHHFINIYGMEVEVKLHTTLTSTLDGDDKSALRPSWFNSSASWREGYAGSTAGLNVMAK